MSEQCKGITKSGAQCKITRNLTDGYCHLHISQASERSHFPPVQKTVSEHSVEESVAPENRFTGFEDQEQKKLPGVSECTEKPVERSTGNRLMTVIFTLVAGFLLLSLSRIRRPHNR